MKNIILLLIITFAFSLMQAQAPKSCCATTEVAASPTATFASFASDKTFRDEHKLPAVIQYEGEGKMISYPTPDGKTSKAYAHMADSSNLYLFVIHEWWGLNDHIKKEADRLFTELGNVNVIALDMYDGKVATTRENAQKYMQAVTDARSTAIITGLMTHVGEQAKIATIGWCFGGGWSLKTSMMIGVHGRGCVMYYGMPELDPNKLKALNSDVLGLFAREDGWITPEVVEKFGLAMDTAGEKAETHIFDAKHAFANPSSGAYNEEAAIMANAMALDYLRARLK